MKNYSNTVRPPKRGSITVSVRDAEKYDAGFPPENLFAFKDWLNKAYNEIPEEYRIKAEIDINSTESYEGSHYATITISYDRPETEAEFKVRQDEYDAALIQQVTAEKDTLYKLKQKYEK